MHNYEAHINIDEEMIKRRKYKIWTILTKEYMQPNYHVYKVSDGIHYREDSLLKRPEGLVTLVDQW